MYYLLLFFIAYILFILMLFPKYRENYLIFKIVNMILILFLIYLVGFRYNVGTDYPTYEKWFHVWYKDITIEWIYTGLNFLIKENGGEFFHLTLLLAIISQVLVVIGFKKWNLSSKEISIALVLYISSYIFIFANGVRQGLAVLVFFIAAKYIVERKFFKFLFILLIGVGFHKSIIIMLPFYFILHRIKLSFFVTFGLIVVTYFVVWSGLAVTILETLMAVTFYGDKYESNELLYTTSSSIISLGVMLKVIILLVLLYFVRKENIQYHLVINFYIIGTIIRILSLSTHLYNRVGWYFQFFEILAAILILKEISNRKVKIVLLIFVLTINIVLMFKLIVLDGDINNFVYKSIFEK